MGWLNLGFMITYSQRTEMQTGDEDAPTPPGAETYARVYSFTGNLGVWRGLSLRLTLPVLEIGAIEGEPSQERTLAPDDAAHEGDAHAAMGGDSHFVGLGDLSLLAHYLFVSESLPPTCRLGFGVGAYLPTGGVSSEDIPSNASFRSGTADPYLTYNGSYDFGTGIGIYTQAFARLVLMENRDGYQASHSLAYGAGVRYRWVQVLFPSLGLDVLHRFHDREHGEEVADSGGDFVYVSGALSLAWDRGIMSGFSFFLSAQVPVYQRVNGTQFAEDFNISVGVGYGFQTFGGQ
ncbi:MAG: hypothetical protein JRF63_11245 [Deltaproteobacteria bacterium]|nr:hypothetical protein [Deltaproteobacteria bacterium]